MLETIQNAPVASLIFAITLLTSLYDFLVDGSIKNKFILHPYTVVHQKQYYRMITSGLIHADWMHLFFNMYVFYAFAFTMEKYVLGNSYYFALIYVFSLIGSHVYTVVKNKDNPSYFALGASGAISGVLFSFVALLPQMELMVFFFPMKAWVFGILYLAFSYFAAKRQFDNVGHDAHFWGAVFGALITLGLMPDEVIDSWTTLLGSF